MTGNAAGSGPRHSGAARPPAKAVPRAAATPLGTATALLGYTPPFRWEELLGFFGRRAIAGVEAVDGAQYWRTAEVTGPDGTQVAGWLKVAHRPELASLHVTVSPGLAPALASVLARLRRMFDLDSDPGAVSRGLATMSQLDPALPVPGLRLPGSFEPFEMAVRAVLGQQITVTAATTLAGRVAQSLGTRVNTGVPGLDRLFPTYQQLLDLPGPASHHLGPLGVIGARAETIVALAQQVALGHLRLAGSAGRPEQRTQLLRIKGVGPWTADYVLMRAGGWQDVFLSGDHGVKSALSQGRLDGAKTLIDSWRPWRSYATVNLWDSLSQKRR